MGVDESQVKYLFGWLQRHKYTQEQAEEFVGRWRRLRAQDSRLCPVCFLNPEEENNEQPLVAAHATGGLHPLFCPHCKTNFPIPEPS